MKHSLSFTKTGGKCQFLDSGVCIKEGPLLNDRTIREVACGRPAAQEIFPSPKIQKLECLSVTVRKGTWAGESKCNICSKAEKEDVYIIYDKNKKNGTIEKPQLSLSRIAQGKLCLISATS